MTHLSRPELVDLLDGVLKDDRRTHAQSCERCRAAAADLADTRAALGDGHVPEPSPLFWDHLSARVRDAVGPATIDRSPWWQWLAVPAAIIAAVVIAFAALDGTFAPGAPAQSIAAPPSVVATAERATPPPDDRVASQSSDEVWTLLQSVASDMDVDDAHSAGFGVRPGAADAAVLELNAAERAELTRLLRTELKRTGA